MHREHQPLTDHAVASVLAEARQAYVAIRTGAGVHVTPQLYSWTGDRLGLFAAAPTLKARRLATGDRIGVLVGNGSEWVAITGTVARYDPLDPRDVVRGALVLPRIARLVAGFALRNAADLAAFAVDAARGRTGRRIPPRRLLLAVEPDRVVPFQDDSVGGAVAGWDTAGGPVAVPASWDGTADRAGVSAAAVAALDLPAEAPASLTVDDYGGAGPAAKSGELLRGRGRLRRDGDAWFVVLDGDRRTTWDGVEARTAPT